MSSEMDLYEGADAGSAFGAKCNAHDRSAVACLARALPLALQYRQATNKESVNIEHLWLRAPRSFKSIDDNRIVYATDISIRVKGASDGFSLQQ
jgi:hypothetical protein